MKTIAIIPARGGSKRLPGKNTMLLGGIPLLVHSILFAQQQDAITAVYVSTDDAHIKEVALHYGAQVIDRPSELSGDLEPTVSALKHVLASLTEKVDTVVVLQPTNPLRPENLFHEAWQVFTKNQVASLFTVSQSHQKLGKIKEAVFIPFNYKPGQRSQDLEPLYYENGLLYIASAQAILNNEIITKDAFPFVVDHPFARVDIDTQDDFDYAVFLLGR
ncbi:cytidylyltransferase domain-containing protein [Flavobacterium cucumis]|uniref:N-acylneuraminate cytidylyltransferase n=1 Tax=Flavobacterium cucumis TaxID=416016 RepID=A0A1M7ZUG7_9FLAO|nr:acylneuraminate cytidylyltransferase family protein [Flavobacterium cucumis]SHO72524.1 N-acylneuraminate cytidylyltransferase [Flavobacterium cucumis]